jgi:hypothetical protein
VINKEAIDLLITTAQHAQTQDDRTEQRLVELDGHTYTPDSLTRLDPPSSSAFGVHTLGAVVNYCMTDPDKLKGDVIVKVNNHKSVTVTGPLRNDCQRDYFIHVDVLGGDDFDRYLNEYLDHETFMIFLQTHFAQAGPIADLMKLVGNVTDEEIVTAEDDGVSQKVGVKVGAALREQETMKNPYKLTPLRSFPEIMLDPVPYIVRLKSGKREGVMPSIALFEADGGAWQLDAVQKIGLYLENGLPEGTVVLY